MSVLLLLRSGAGARVPLSQESASWETAQLAGFPEIQRMVN